LNYTVTEKECFASLNAVSRFRPYIELLPLTVITGNYRFQRLMTLKDLNGRLGLSLALQVYDFQIEHRKRKDKVVADMLSRISEVGHRCVQFLNR